MTVATEETTAKSGATKKATRKTAKGTAKETAGRSRNDAPRASSSPRRPGAGQIAADAARQLLELTGREAEGVTGLEKTDDGWRVEVEVVEVRRIPNTTDVLAIYQVDVDEDGRLEGYHRVRRYVRGSAGDD
jgi:hypothetical protein